MTDLDKARRIVATREQWVAEPGDLEEIIAIAVAEGIALGRKEGLAIAAELLGKSPGTAPRRQSLESIKPTDGSGIV